MTPTQQSSEKTAIQTIGIVGAGLMGSGIASACLAAEKNVRLFDADFKTAQKACEGINVDGNLTVISAFDQFTGCDLVIESITENVEAKHDVLAQIEKRLGKEALLASNTSSIPITELAQVLEHRERFCGIHFCHPELMKLVEVISGNETSEFTRSTAARLVSELGKTPVNVKDGPGFVVNRLLSAMLDQATRVAMRGTPIPEIDLAMRKFGFAAGPFEIIDTIGADTCLNAGLIMGRRGIQCVNDSPIIPRMVKFKRLGRKVSEGFYEYGSDGSRGNYSKVTQKKIEAYLCEPKPPNAPPIAEQIVGAMLIEAERILKENLVASPNDIDQCVIHGLTFPAKERGLLGWSENFKDKTRVLNWLKHNRNS